MTTVTGIIQEVNNFGRGKGSHVLINGVKYGAFDPVKAGIDTAVVGEEVTFTVAVNGVYQNIHDGITKTGQPGSPAPSPAPTTGGGWKGGKAAASRVFPIPQLDGQRSIIRQNSLTQANAFARSQGMTLAPADLITIAREFEHFSAGDDITEAAEALAGGTQ